MQALFLPGLDAFLAKLGMDGTQVSLILQT